MAKEKIEKPKSDLKLELKQQVEFKQANLDPVKKLIDEKVSDANLSDNDIDEILDLTKQYYKETSLTEHDIKEISNYVNNSLDKQVEKNDKKSIWLRILGALAIIVWVILMPQVISGFKEAFELFSQYVQEVSTTTIVLMVLRIVFAIVCTAMSIATGILMFFKKRTAASRVVLCCIAVSCLDLIVVVSLHGIGQDFFIGIIYAAIQIALSIYLQPQLAKEREFGKRIVNLDIEIRAEQGRLGLSANPNKGYIELDFFNLFWIFVLGSIVGLLAEDIFHMLFVWQPGEFHDRAGLLFGPFSPIYGFGGAIMTICLNRFYKIHPALLFAICTVIGGAFEYFVSWYLEVSFGVVAWDYSGYFLNINGRTCLLFAAMFGVMGFVWIKWALPLFLKLMAKIPWKLRYPITTVCAILMIINCIMTVQALDCWSQRMAGRPAISPIEQFYEQNFDNEKMAKRFESMTINPEMSSRSDIEQAQS